MGRTARAHTPITSFTIPTRVPRSAYRSLLVRDRIYSIFARVRRVVRRVLFLMMVQRVGPVSSSMIQILKLQVLGRGLRIRDLGVVFKGRRFGRFFRVLIPMVGLRIRPTCKDPSFLSSIRSCVRCRATCSEGGVMTRSSDGSRSHSHPSNYH